MRTSRPVEHKTADRFDRKDLLRNDLRRIENVEVECVGEVLIEKLHAELPFREGSRLDRLPEVAAMEIRIGPIDLDCLVPGDGLQAELRFPVEFDEGRFIRCVDEAEGMNAEPLHEPE